MGRKKLKKKKLKKKLGHRNEALRQHLSRRSTGSGFHSSNKYSRKQKHKTRYNPETDAFDNARQQVNQFVLTLLNSDSPAGDALVRAFPQSTQSSVRAEMLDLVDKIKLAYLGELDEMEAMEASLDAVAEYRRDLRERLRGRGLRGNQIEAIEDEVVAPLVRVVLSPVDSGGLLAVEEEGEEDVVDAEEDETPGEGWLGASLFGGGEGVEELDADEVEEDVELDPEVEKILAARKGRTTQTQATEAVQRATGASKDVVAPPDYQSPRTRRLGDFKPFVVTRRTGLTPPDAFLELVAAERGILLYSLQNGTTQVWIKPRFDEARGVWYGLTEVFRGKQGVHSATKAAQYIRHWRGFDGNKIDWSRARKSRLRTPVYGALEGAGEIELIHKAIDIDRKMNESYGEAPKSFEDMKRLMQNQSDI